MIFHDNAGAAGPARHQRHVVAGKQPFAEHRARVGEAALDPHRVGRPARSRCLAAVAAGRIEVDVVGDEDRHEAEMDFVGQVHVVDARLHSRTGPTCTRTPPSQSCDFCVRRLNVVGSTPTGRDHADALVDIRHAEALRGAPEHREVSVEAMLEADVIRLVGFARVERDAAARRRKQPKRNMPPGAFGIENRRAP